MGFLHSRGWFAKVREQDAAAGIFVSAALSIAFGVVAVIVDITVGFPQEINVPIPQSLLFYPAIAFVVEVVFHLAPLALAAGVLPMIAKHLPFGAATRSAEKWNLQFNGRMIVIVALLEPIFHLGVAASGQSFSRLDIFVGMHVFVFNIVQLTVFGRYGFLAMIALRIFYYLLWHVAWGHVRLELLF